jgi:hypothetical protein
MTWVRGVSILLGGVLVTAGVSKLCFPSAGAIVMIMGAFEIGEEHWTVVERFWLAIAVYEVGLGVAMVSGVAAHRWQYLLGGVVVGFVVFDVVRWLRGAEPDCGCFGEFQIASQWWHVWLKHGVLVGAAAAIALVSPVPESLVLSENCAEPVLRRIGHSESVDDQ